MSKVRDKLKQDLLQSAPWDALSDHIDNIFVVRGVNIIDVGVAFAENDTTRVKDWLGDGRLRRPSPIQITKWEADRASFVALIVQPWILLQAETES